MDEFMTDKMAAEEMKTAVEMFNDFSAIQDHKVLPPQETDLHNYGHHEPYNHHHAAAVNAPAVAPPAAIDNEHHRPPPPSSPTIKTPPKKKRRRSSKEAVKSGDDENGGGTAGCSSWQRLYYRVLAIESQLSEIMKDLEHVYNDDDIHDEENSLKGIKVFLESASMSLKESDKYLRGKIPELSREEGGGSRGEAEGFESTISPQQFTLQVVMIEQESSKSDQTELFSDNFHIDQKKRVVKRRHHNILDQNGAFDKDSVYDILRLGNQLIQNDLKNDTKDDEYVNPEIKMETPDEDFYAAAAAAEATGAAGKHQEDEDDFYAADDDIDPDYDPESENFDLGLDMDKDEIKDEDYDYKSRSPGPIPDENNMIECDICGKRLNKNRLQHHKKVHRSDTYHECSKCDETFEKKSELTAHMSEAHDFQKVQCKTCGKTLYNERNLKKHLARNMCQRVLTKNDPKKFKCEICNMPFKSEEGLKKHSETFVHDRFSCDVCGKHFSQKSFFERHMITHSDEKPFPCEVCGVRFKLLKQVKAHRQHVHEENTPVACDLCGKWFKHKQYLKYHMVTHTDVRAFSCEICGQTYRQLSGLTKHKLSHTNERPHSCTVCGKSFNHKSNFEKHKLIHDKDKHFKCDICTRSFSFMYALKRHLQRVHKFEEK